MSTTDPTVVTPAVLREWALPAPGSGKDARGQLVVVGGTATTPGAVLLAAEAGLRAGAGKLALAVADPIAVQVGVAVPEAAASGLPSSDGMLSEEAADELVDRLGQADAALVGPGFTDPGRSSALLARALPQVSTSLVLDGLASAYLTDHPDGLRHLEGRAVLTVNPTELARTAGVDEDELSADPLAPARQVAQQSQVVVLCGGAEKHVAAPDGRAWVIQGGGPGLGVSGSGDVQAGIVAGLLARGAEPAQAAVWGGYLHGRVGERLAARVGSVGYLARELPPEVPTVLSELE